MAEFRYLIVGGGMTADAACRGIRDHDPGGSIGLVGEEPHPPYARPPLSKALWQGKDEATVWRGTADLGVELVLGRRVVEVDLDARTAVDDAGEAYRYERLLLATGGRPRRLPGDGRVVYYRTLDDYRRIREAAVEGARFPARSLGGKLVRVEHEDHANSHGHAVGANMAGANTPYTNLPFFYSDLFELGYEAVGEVDSRLDTVAAWAEPNRKGVVCYVDDGGRPLGFLLWDVWGKVADARVLIDEAAPVERAQLEALLQ